MRNIKELMEGDVLTRKDNGMKEKITNVDYRDSASGKLIFHFFGYVVYDSAMHKIFKHDLVSKNFFVE